MTRRRMYSIGCSLASVTLCGGCPISAAFFPRQGVSLEVKDAQTGDPLSNVRVVLLRDEGDVRGFASTYACTDTFGQGALEVVDLCSPTSSCAICPEPVSTGSFVARIETDVATELLSLDFARDNIVVGELFTVRVLSVGEPFCDSEEGVPDLFFIPPPVPSCEGN